MELEPAVFAIGIMARSVIVRGLFSRAAPAWQITGLHVARWLYRQPAIMYLSACLHMLMVQIFNL